MMFQVFVYGSLKRGFYNHHYLEKAAFKGTVCTRDPDFYMVGMPSEEKAGEFYPAVIANGESRIKGELYVVSQQQMDDLDILEEQDIHFKRRIITLDNEEKAWIYILINKDSRPFHEGHERILYCRRNKISQWV